MGKNNIISVQEQLLLEDLKKFLPTQYEIFPNTYKRLTPIVNKVIEDAINQHQIKYKTAKKPSDIVIRALKEVFKKRILIKTM